MWNNCKLTQNFFHIFFCIFSRIFWGFQHSSGYGGGKEVRKENLTLCPHNLYAGDVPGGCRMRKQTKKDECSVVRGVEKKRKEVDETRSSVISLRANSWFLRTGIKYSIIFL